MFMPVVACILSVNRTSTSRRRPELTRETPWEHRNGPLPVGTVTFLLTDVEGSTTGWEADRGAMAGAIVRHYEILDAAVRARGGVRPVEQGEGDSVVAVFALASEAVRAAVDIQLALAAEPWPDGTSLAVRRCIPGRRSCATPATTWARP
jgi:class 3 adenylate cyclase